MYTCSSSSGIPGELPYCSEGIAITDPNTSNSGFHFTQMGEQTCLSEFSLVSDTSTTSVRIGRTVFVYLSTIDVKMICLGNNSWKNS